MNHKKVNSIKLLFPSFLVGSPELVTRVETLLGSGNIAEAEALVVSVLNHIKDKATLATSISGISSAAFTRPGGVSTSRLPPAYTIGMLVIAKHPSGPSLLSRPAVLDQLYSLLTLSIGKSRINISPTGNITSKSRNINVSFCFVAYLNGFSPCF